MSYRIYLRSDECKTCGHVDEGPMLPDPTYNLTEIFHLALTGDPMPNSETSEFDAVIFNAKTDSPRGLRVLNGKVASETEVTLRVALMRLRDPSRLDEFKKLEDPGGWGDIGGAIIVLEKLFVAAQENPNLKWVIS
jgi:hypothetical protein